MKSKHILIINFLLILFIFSCNKNDVEISNNIYNVIESSTTNESDAIDKNIIDVRFSLGEPVKYNNNIVEDTEELKRIGKEHSVKYYSYLPENKPDGENVYPYFDVGMNQRYLIIDQNLKLNSYSWEDKDGVFAKKNPKNCKMSYGVDVSKHNGKIDFNKVKDAGFDFVFVRIVYRGYGKAGNLKQDELYDINLSNAKKAGLKVGAYVFSQATNENEALEEAKFAVEILKGYNLDLPLVFDPETIKGDVARTDNVEGLQFTKNAIAFCEEVKKSGYRPAIYSNLVWEDYYYDLSKLQDYEIWYADYSKIPQTPYDFNYWQFSEVGIVDGIDGMVDLNVMIERE